eukprot:Filipodium_phascolosomae@DN5144_c0_g1_i1.p1
MPRAERGTNKWLANKMKAKGLQKLKWYCQMCQKQCRDENGFKCHRMSEAHQRQMQVFSQRSGTFVDSFSREFEKKFMQLMKTRYYNTRVLANTVYCDHIADKQHVHMNSTVWVTLSGFVQYLGRSGQCEIEHTPKGWFIKYIDRDPEKLQRDKERSEREKDELDTDERERQRLEETIRQAKDSGAYKPTEYSGINRTVDEGPIRFAVNPLKREHKSILPSGKNHESLFIVDSTKLELSPKVAKQEVPQDVIAVEELPWVVPGLVVKILSGSRGNKYFKCKGTVSRVQSLYECVVKVFDSGDVIKIDQAQLETVIPTIGGKVQFVLGKHRGSIGYLASVNFDAYSCVVKIKLDDETVEITGVQYEEICKFDEQ